MHCDQNIGAKLFLIENHLGMMARTIINLLIRARKHKSVLEPQKKMLEALKN